MLPSANDVGLAKTSMHANSFLDTNILLYAISKLPEEADKSTIANQLMQTQQWGLSVQVCQEFYVAATRKIARPISPEEAENFLRLFVQRPLATNSADLLFKAVAQHRQHKLSFWDGAIVAAAQELGATTLFSEDLNDGQVFDTVRVVNPFKVKQPA
jgi:predicted nucleic acid-binding protein